MKRSCNRLVQVLTYCGISIFLAGALLLSGCFKERFDMSSGAILQFSTDTLRFDTVFTSVGSATRSFRVYNRNELSVRVSRIYLEQQGARYRINVDGLIGPEVRDVEIRGRDSIWVFAEVTIDPDDPVSESPFITEDHVVFETNGNVQRVLLEAWGQNANYIPDRFHGNKISILTCNLETLTWNDPKPYVIYGTLLIDSCQLILPAGTRVYVHGGIADNVLGVYNDGLIYFLNRGRMLSQGTVDNPVIIQDDRLEEDYAGLWSGIQFGRMSGPHRLEHTTIRQAAAALAVDSASQLELDGCIIHSTAGPGVFSRHANVLARNSLFYDNGTNSVALTYGGNHVFDYCTIVSSGNDAAGLVVNNFFCPDPLCQEGIFVNPLKVTFRNSIIVGSSSDELVLSDAAPGQDIFDVTIKDCIVQIKDLLDEDQYPDFLTTLCTDCITYTFGDTLFASPDEFDYHLDTLSIAEEQATVIAVITTDLDGRERDATMPDIGCYEYYPE